VTVLGAGFILPPAFVVHEVSEAARVLVKRMMQKAQVSAGQLHHACAVGNHFPGHENRHQRPRVIIGAIAVAAIGNDELGMLHDPDVIGQPGNMVQFGLGHIPGGGIQRPGPEYCFGLLFSFFLHLLENFQVPPRHLFPGHIPAESVSALAHGMPFHLPSEKTVDLPGHGLSVAERNDPAAPVGQHFLGVPVRGGDRRLPASQGIGERARDDLFPVEVGCDINIRRSDEFT